MQELVSSSGIRGLAIDEVSPRLCMDFGLAISSNHKGTYALGYDVRVTSQLLARSLANGLNAGGSDVVSLGLAPTPAVAFYSKGKAGGAMITASHNPPEYNGIKLFDRKGASVAQSLYCDLLSMTEKAPKPIHWESLGQSRSGNGLYEYLESLASLSNTSKKWNVGIDPGNGSTCITAATAFKLAGVKTSAVNLAPDGYFKGRGSEPDEKALISLSKLVREKNLDVGFAFDGDGDRVAIVDERGSFIPQDLSLAFVASNIVARRGSGDVVVNVDTSAIVDLMVESVGGIVHRSRVGDVYVLEDLVNVGGAFGGETCGAWIFPDKSLCPDGVFSAFMFLKLLEESGIKPSELGKGLPRLFLTRRKIACPNPIKIQVMESLENKIDSHFSGAVTSDIDGIRAEFRDKSWILIRPSGTEPLLRITTEAMSEQESAKLAELSSELVHEALEEFTRKQ